MSEVIQSDISSNQRSEYSIMTRLRVETRGEHERIEKVQYISRLFSHDYTLAEYQNLLARLYGFYRAIEPMIYVGSNFSDRQKTVLLVRDLETLGLTYTKIRNLPVSTSLPSLDSFNCRMGALYVLEGSTLGAQLISSQLLKHFRDTIAGAIHFYTCYGDRVGAKWHEFRQFLSRSCNDASSAQEVIASARNTFCSFQHWLERPMGH